MLVKMIFKCCPRIQIDTLLPPILIYSLETGTEIINIDSFIKIISQ